MTLSAEVLDRERACFPLDGFILLRELDRDTNRHYYYLESPKGERVAAIRFACIPSWVLDAFGAADRAAREPDCHPSPRDESWVSAFNQEQQRG